MTITELKQYRSLKREIADLRRTASRSEHRLTQCIEICTEITAFIESIDDSLTRQIFEYKYVSGRYKVSWQQVADEIGGGNKASTMRMRVIRYLEKLCVFK